MGDGVGVRLGAAALATGVMHAVASRAASPILTTKGLHVVPLIQLSNGSARIRFLLVVPVTRGDMGNVCNVWELGSLKR